MKMENITQVLDTHDKDLEVKTHKEVHVHLQWAQKIQDMTNYLERQKHLDIFWHTVCRSHRHSHHKTQTH